MHVTTGSWDTGRGWSPSPDEFAAGAAAGGSRTLVLFFADTTEQAAAEAAAQLQAVLPLAQVVGCSSAGLILGDALSQAEVVAAVVHLEHQVPQVARAGIAEHGDAESAGRSIGRQLAAHVTSGESAIFVLADGMRVNGARLVDALTAELPDGVGVSGGLAGDGDRFADAWTFADGQARRGDAVAIAITDPSLSVGYGTEGGWEGFGPFRTVTGSDGTVLHTLDDRPALTLYKEYLGERAEELPASALYFPLLLRSPDASVEVVRTILGVDDNASSMTFAGEVTQGWTARLTRTTMDSVVDAAAIAAEEAVAVTPSPTLAILVSCVGRRMVLGQRTDEEIEAATTELGSPAAVIGFYAYGEISPTRGLCELHNQTMTITAISTKGST